MPKIFVLLIVPALLSCSSIPRDKQKHFAAGVITSGIVIKITVDKDIGCATAATVGVSKEIYDSQQLTHTADPWDALATTAGCLVWKLFR